MAIDSEDDLEDDRDDDDMESDSDSEASASSSTDSEGNVDDTDETLGISSGFNDQMEARTTAAGDPYVAHFSTPAPAPPQLDSLQSTKVVPHTTGSSCKVNTTPLFKSSVDVHMAGPLLDAWDAILTNHVTVAAPLNGKSPKKKQSNAHTRRAWEEFAAGPYQHVREVLARNWKSVNRSAMKRSSASSGEDNGSNRSARTEFSPLQLAMYPAIARYADVLISSETRQVSLSRR
jgi:hypothetical protein